MKTGQSRSVVSHLWEGPVVSKERPFQRPNTEIQDSLRGRNYKETKEPDHIRGVHFPFFTLRNSQETFSSVVPRVTFQVLESVCTDTTLGDLTLYKYLWISKVPRPRVLSIVERLEQIFKKYHFFSLFCLPSTRIVL